MAVSGCVSCQVATGLLNTEGGTLVQSRYFNAQQDVEYPVPGMIILASNRHFKCLDEMTDEESLEFNHLIKRLRKAQREALGIEAVYYFYNEDTRHHFHLWMVPRYDWMEQFGKSVESLRPALEYARNNFLSAESKAAVVRAAQSLRTSLGQ